MHTADGQVARLDRPTSLEQQLVRLPAGAHACQIYTTRAEQLRAVVPFFREGRRRREQCLYVADAATLANALAELEASGIAAQAAIASGELRLLTAREAYLRHGRFDPDAMIALLLACAESAHAAGYAGVRAVGEMSWALTPEVGGERLVEYEARLNTDLPPAAGIRTICQYDRGRFGAEVIRTVLRTHPVAIVGEHVHDNPYFEPPELVLGGADGDARRVEWMLDQLQRRTRRALAVAELGSWALARVSPRDLTTAAAHLLAQELGADCVEVFDLSGSAVRRVAGVGLSAEASAAPQGAAGNVWPSVDSTPVDQPVLVPDWRHETRVAHRPELQALGIASSAGVPIGATDGQDRHPDGVVWVHRAQPRTFTDDELLLVETVAGQLAQAVARSRAEAELHLFLDNVPDLIARFDRDLRYVYVNPAVERLTGLPANRLIGKTSREAVLPEALAPAWELVLRQAWRSGREQLTELVIPTPSGDRRFETRILPEFSAAAAPAGAPAPSPGPGPGPGDPVRSLLSISRDVTEQRQAEAERTALYHEVVAQQGRLTELISRLEQDRARDLQRTAHAIQAEHLTPRERDVLRLLARGWSNREIAAELRLTPGTVKNHVASILAKLDASDRTQAAARAVDLRLAQPD